MANGISTLGKHWKYSRQKVAVWLWDPKLCEIIQCMTQVANTATKYEQPIYNAYSVAVYTTWAENSHWESNNYSWYGVVVVFFFWCM